MSALRLPLLAALFASLLISPTAHAAPFVSTKGYAITPAPQWLVNHSGLMGADVFIVTHAASGLSPNLNVNITPAKPGQTLEQGQAQLAALYPRLFTQFHMTKTGFETVGGARALLVAGTFLQGTMHLSIRQDLVLKSGKVYTFTCTMPTETQARYAPAFAQMMHSVRWTR